MNMKTDWNALVMKHLNIWNFNLISFFIFKSLNFLHNVLIHITMYVKCMFYYAVTSCKNVDFNLLFRNGKLMRNSFFSPSHH